MKRAHALFLTVTCLFLLGTVAQGDAQQRTRALSVQEQEELERLSAEVRANTRKRDATRQTARQIGREIEDLRQRIIDISRRQGASETRSAVFRARLETLNLQEADITRKLTAMRAKEARLLSALQIYTRNPPPAIFISTRRANDAVVAAIIMREITPELQKRTRALAAQNAELVRLRRQAALQNESLFVAESDVSRQRSEIEALISQKLALEDQLLSQADKLEARAEELKTQENRMRGELPLRGLLGIGQKAPNQLQQPVVGDKVSDFGQVLGSQSEGGRPERGVRFSVQPGAQVTAPIEGEVEFAGPVESYGQVVILNAGNNYHVVLTGIGRVFVDKGQTLRRHEPIGRMPNLSERKVTLYMELRHGETPVNPLTPLQVSSR
ncbi:MULTISPECIES: murein hydrolase activator EnvC [Asticcacaulis]|uniref:murein hydrolase activator EnvC family protein n=1 Tax=Asticcacaulis TaxID=76890 RepID=UPI001AE445D9|nr:MULTISPECIES: peptidoglycan DD-metalloendopeptidase family protein [Asticcacaulis]MBP2160142.1 septal ring factor EnvC (AmiA/AmiB activator) [Asticcacaulis solisilvae]MDR6801187.1 septal ring factor EnvC (AmiA/AmiB activator) [Asticcacaulis sp. BE141]